MTPLASGVPNKPKMPMRTIRIPDELWAAAQAKAEAEGVTVSEVVRRELERWVRKRR